MSVSAGRTPALEQLLDEAIGTVDSARIVTG
jgi:hypothetical protein